MALKVNVMCIGQQIIYELYNAKTKKGIQGNNICISKQVTQCLCNLAAGAELYRGEYFIQNP